MLKIIKVKICLEAHKKEKHKEERKVTLDFHVTKAKEKAKQLQRLL